MQSGIRSQRHIDKGIKANKTKEARAEQQRPVSLQDLASAVETVFSAFVNFEEQQGLIRVVAPADMRDLVVNTPKVMVELIKTPDTNVKSKDKGREIKSAYVLHAIALIMSNENPSDILSQMSYDNIQVLKKAISMARTLDCPDKDAAEYYLEQRKGERESFARVAMAKSMRIYIKVAEWWDYTVTELRKWADAVENYQPVMPVAEIVETEEAEVAEEQPVESEASEPQVVEEKKTCTFEELAHMMEFKKDSLSSNVLPLIRKYLEKNQPDFVAKFESWFIRDGHQKKFLIEHFDEFQELFKLARAQKKADKTAEKQGKKQAKASKVAKADKPKAKRRKRLTKVEEQEIFAEVAGEQTKVTEPVEQTQEAQTIQSGLVGEHPTNLVEIKALEHKLAAWKKMLQDKKEELKKLEAEHGAVFEQLGKVSPNKRGALYDQARGLNEKIVSVQNEISSIKNEIKAGNKLLAAQRELNAKVAKFLAKSM